MEVLHEAFAAGVLLRERSVPATVMDLAEVEFFEGYCLFESNLTVKPSRDNLLFQQLQRIVLLLHSVQYPRPANDHLCLLLIQL